MQWPELGIFLPQFLYTQVLREFFLSKHLLNPKHFLQFWHACYVRKYFIFSFYSINNKAYTMADIEPDEQQELRSFQDTKTFLNIFPELVLYSKYLPHKILF